jgi:ferritin-like metal-binding protein YciE
MKDLKELFVHGLRDMYWVENRLISELKTMSEKASNPELKQAFLDHRAETETHLQKLDDVFAMVDMTPRAEVCDGLKGILEEGHELLDKCETDALCDALLIEAGNKVEHYEIASYGTLKAFANELNLPPAASIFEGILEQEVAADKTLSQLAESSINQRAEVSH